MIVQAIADFTPGTLSKMLKSLQPTEASDSARERSREREKEKKHGTA